MIATVLCSPPEWINERRNWWKKSFHMLNPTITAKQKWPRVIILAELVTIFRCERGCCYMTKKKKKKVGHTVKRSWAKRIKYKWTGELKHLAEKGESRVVAEWSVLHWLSSSGSSQVILMGSLIMSVNHPIKMSSAYCTTEAISSPHLSVTFSRADLFSCLLLNTAWKFRNLREETSVKIILTD